MRRSLYKLDIALDKIEEKINNIKQKVKIDILDEEYFKEKFVGLAGFFDEASRLQESKSIDPLDKRFVNLAIKLLDKGIYPVNL